MKPWNTKSVRELQLYLKDWGVTYTNELKTSLVQLCSDAESMGLEIDPDGLHEDRAEILAKKLIIGDVTLQCPTLLTNYTNNIAVLSLLSICDLYNYLMSFHFIPRRRLMFIFNSAWGRPHIFIYSLQAIVCGWQESSITGLGKVKKFHPLHMFFVLSPIVICACAPYTV